MYRKKITTEELCTYFNPTVILAQVMPSYVSHGWRVKKPFSGLVPEVDAQGERWELSSGKKREVKQYEIGWRKIRVMEDVRKKKDTEDSSFFEL